MQKKKKKEIEKEAHAFPDVHESMLHLHVVISTNLIKYKANKSIFIVRKTLMFYLSKFYD